MGHREQCWMVRTRGGGMDGHGDIQKNCGDQPLWRHWWSENVPAPDKEKVRVREQEIFHKTNVIIT